VVVVGGHQEGGVELGSRGEGEAETKGSLKALVVGAEVKS